MDWIALFVSALISATIAPGGSEALLIWQFLQGKTPWLLVAVASVGNTLGACVSYALARAGRRLWRVRPSDRLQRAEAWMQRYGGPILLGSWLPLVGDALCVAAGALRHPMPSFLFWTALGKTARYGALIALAS